VIEVGMSTAFGCTLQGRVEPAEVLRLLQAVLDAGADRVGLADTVGYADPAMVQSLFEAAFKWPATSWPAATFTTRAVWASPMCMPRCKPASHALTPAWPA
jgi:hypothetical protein